MYVLATIPIQVHIEGMASALNIAFRAKYVCIMSFIPLIIEHENNTIR